jgi:16S rRNA (cytosine1402-N4)-methyltransferase
MTYGHRPVMADEVASILAAGPGAIYVDATVGYGGHAERLAEMAGPGGRVIGLDRDPIALDAAAKNLACLADRVTLVESRFSRLDDVLREAGISEAQGILFDLGVSSPQLDEATRGFSFHGSSPLDMRMDQKGPSAADLLNELSLDSLTRIFRDLGEEKWASRIAGFVVRARGRTEFERADQLVDIIKEAVPAAARRRGPHPARRVFQALRIAVNDELAELTLALDKVPSLLAVGGRVVVISYHSLEDRIAKLAFRGASIGCRCPSGLPECRCGGRPSLKILTRRPMLPSQAEVAGNPRARSAKVRAAEKV